MKSMKTANFISKTIIHLILILLSIAFLLPFLWMVSTSLKPDTQIFVFPPEWVPRPFQWSNYIETLNYIPYFRYFGNTLFVATLDVLGTVLVVPVVAYGLARLEWKGRDLVFILTLAVMMIPGEVTMIPTFIMFNKFKLVGSYAPLILPSFFGKPFMIFLCRQFFMQLPKDLEDAARVDGLSEFMIYLKIMLPLAKPAVLTVGLFRFMYAWNDFMGPLVYLSKDTMYTLSIGLQMFTTQYDTQWSLLMAATVLTTLPVILLYFFVQKRFIQGMTFSGIKG